MFVRDRLRGTTSLVTVPLRGVPRSDRPRGYRASISGNGRYVVFGEHVSDLVVGDTNDNADVFVRDLKRRVTRRVVVSPPFDEGAGANEPTISADGRYVAFWSLNGFTPGDRNRAFDVFLTDVRDRVTTRVSRSGRAHRGSFAGVVSGNGRRVAFWSRASNLVETDTNGRPDVFVFDRIDRTTVRVSLTSSGAQASYPARRFAGSEVAVSRTGRFIAFTSRATNLVPDDSNGRQDVFVRDIRRGVTVRVSVRSGGGEVCRGARPDRVLPCTRDPAISPDGRWVGFTSWADDLVDGDTNGTEDVFLHDRQTGTTSRVSVSTAGTETCPRGLDQCNSTPAISDDGRFVAFNSRGSTLIDDDTNHAIDVFLRGPLPAP